MEIRRSSGILLHPTSLPGKFPLGNIGADARRFIDFLAAGEQSWWQMLPTNPIGAGNSPYSSVSSFAGEARLVDMDWLARRGWLRPREIAAVCGQTETNASFAKANKAYRHLWARAFSRFEPDGSYQRFCKNNTWLDDYALFSALTKCYRTARWCDWPRDIARRNCDWRELRSIHQSQMNLVKFQQYCFYEQWRELRGYAREKHIRLIGDLPIFVAYESADVWSNQGLFWLQSDGSPKYVAGVPPDYFNKDGQLWGNALYHWANHKKQDFNWWVERLKQLRKQFDLVRIDHFIGFHRYWEIPAAATSAKKGRWRKAPGRELLATLQRELKGLPLIAEDLGKVVPAVTALRDEFGLPGMQVLQFAFGNDEGAKLHQPHRCPRNAVIYTGTHDNDTSRGWFRDAQRQAKTPSPDYDYDKMRAYLGATQKDAAQVMVREAMQSHANLCITPMQDLLNLGSSARMNIPGTPSGNWRWRMQPNAASIKISKWLSELTESCHRCT